MIEDIIADDHFWLGVRGKFLRAVEPLFREFYFAGVRAGARVLRRMRTKDTGDDLASAIAEDPEFAFRTAMYLTTFSDAWWQTLDNSTRSQLYNVLKKANEKGWDMRQIKAAVEPLFSRERAQRIAQTETTRLFGAGAQASYRAFGVTSWSWRTAEDGRVCPVCESQQEGGPYSIDIPFLPGHVSCRCWPVPTPAAVAEAGFVGAVPRELLSFRRELSLVGGA